MLCEFMGYRIRETDLRSIPYGCDWKYVTESYDYGFLRYLETSISRSIANRLFIQLIRGHVNRIYHCANVMLSETCFTMIINQYGQWREIFIFMNFDYHITRPLLMYLWFHSIWRLNPDVDLLHFAYADRFVHKINKQYTMCKFLFSIKNKLKTF